MATADEFGLDLSRLDRQLIFLQDRSRWHEEQAPRFRNDHSHVLCSIALKKEGAATAMLLGDYDTAIALLANAAEVLIQLGSFAGYQLSAIARRPHPYQIFTAPKGLGEEALGLGSLGRLLRGWAQDGFEHEVSADERDLIGRSLGSGYQLMCLYQFLMSSRGQAGSLTTLVEIVKTAINRRPVFHVGTDGITSVAYMSLLERMSLHNHDIVTIGDLDAVFNRRSMQILAAKRDRHHWKMLMRPATLIDFDLVMLAISAIDNGDLERVHMEAKRRDNLVSLPFHAALRLRGGLEKQETFQ